MSVADFWFVFDQRPDLLRSKTDQDIDALTNADFGKEQAEM